jgi:hypothetical protein
MSADRLKAVSFAVPASYWPTAPSQQIDVAVVPGVLLHHVHQHPAQ